MNSNITLSIKDPDLRKEYFLKRNQEIQVMSTLIVSLAILMNSVVAIISVFKKWDEYIVELWLGRILAIVINLMLIFASCKIPAKFAQYHGPLLVMVQLGTLIWSRGNEPLPSYAMTASIAGLLNTMIFGLLCNANWILTGVSVAITVFTTLTYYTIKFKYVDYVTFSVVLTTMLFYLFALHKIEKRDKTELLSLAQIRRMNKDFKSILMNLPEGIILINNDTN